MDGHILVVEDDSQFRQMLQEFLEIEGYTVQTAANGVEALKLVDGQYPRLIVLDVMMPDMDGLTFVQELQLRDLRPEMPVLLISAAEFLPEHLMRLDIDSFLAKPFEMQAFLGAVRRLLSKGLRQA